MPKYGFPPSPAARFKKMKLLLGGGPDLRIIPHGRFDTTPLFTHHPPVTASRAA